MPARKQVSIHGKRAFLDKDDVLTGSGGMAAGGIDKPIVVYPGPDVAALYDDFHGDALAGRWIPYEGTDTGAHATQGILSVTTNGVARLLSGTGYASLAQTIAGLRSGRQWKADQGNLRWYARVKLPEITNTSAFFGFTDDTGTVEAPIWEDTGSVAQVATAADAVGFLFDTANSHTAWQLVGVKASSVKTPVDLSSGPTANVYVDLEIEIDASGNAAFFMDGAYVGKIDAAVTATVALAPVVSVWPHVANAAKSVDIDMIAVSALRDTGT